MPTYGKRIEVITEYPFKRKPKYLMCIDKEGYVWECPNRHMVREMKQAEAAKKAVQPTEQPPTQ